MLATDSHFLKKNTSRAKSNRPWPGFGLRVAGRQGLVGIVPLESDKVLEAVLPAGSPAPAPCSSVGGVYVPPALGPAYPWPTRPTIGRSPQSQGGGVGRGSPPQTEKGQLVAPDAHVRSGQSRPHAKAVYPRLLGLSKKSKQGNQGRLGPRPHGQLGGARRQTSLESPSSKELVGCQRERTPGVS